MACRASRRAARRQKGGDRRRWGHPARGKERGRGRGRGSERQCQYPAADDIGVPRCLALAALAVATAAHVTGGAGQSTALRRRSSQHGGGSHGGEMGVREGGRVTLGEGSRQREAPGSVWEPAMVYGMGSGQASCPARSVCPAFLHAQQSSWCRDACSRCRNTRVCPAQRQMRMPGCHRGAGILDADADTEPSPGRASPSPSPTVATAGPRA